MPSKILLVFALYIEAKVFIEKYEIISKERFKGLQIFETNNYIILISWIWKTKAIFWVTYAFLKYPKIQSAINIWIAWSNKAKIWDIILINKIIDNDSKKTYYPDIGSNQPFHTSELKTIWKPQLNDNWNQIIDMEGSWFFEISNKFLNVDKIMLIKVISDNTNIAYLEKWFVEELMNKKLSKIINFIRTLNRNDKIDLQEKEQIIEFAQNNFFSLTQSRLLSDLVWSLHVQTWNSVSSILKNIKTKNKQEAGAHLRHLETVLDNY